jgi:glutathione peroxidase
MKLIATITYTLTLCLASTAFGGPTLENLNLVGLTGKPLTPEVTKGKVALVVNVASRCGYTRQYDGLQKLFNQYQAQGLVVLGVPCNQFGGQEPGTADEIAQFCKRNFGVTFPMLQKQDVNGKNRSALYQHLISSQVGKSKDVRWNFEKFLVGRDGQVVARFPSSTSPTDAKLIKAIESAL